MSYSENSIQVVFIQVPVLFSTNSALLSKIGEKLGILDIIMSHIAGILDPSNDLTKLLGLVLSYTLVSLLLWVGRGTVLWLTN